MVIKLELTSANLRPESLLQSADQRWQDVHPQQNHLGYKYLLFNKLCKSWKKIIVTVNHKFGKI